MLEPTIYKLDNDTTRCDICAKYGIDRAATSAVKWGTSKFITMCETHCMSVERHLILAGWTPQEK